MDRSARVGGPAGLGVPRAFNGKGDGRRGSADGLSSDFARAHEWLGRNRPV